MRIEESKEFSEFKCYELINGLGLEKNYDTLNIDTSNWMDRLFSDFIRHHEIQIIHINEIFGFSSSMINVARQHGIKVVVTVHEYWWLCAHRVMVDFNNRICNGPSNMQKCSFCSQKILNDINSRYTIRREKIRNSIPKIFKLIVDIYSLRRFFSPKRNDKTVDLKFGSANYTTFTNPKLEDQLRTRLQKNIEALNTANLVIGVSHDVKDKLTTFGVDPAKILVQHIGSTIAEIKVEHIKEVNKSNIVFGFIGGIGYYKGVHQLIDAFTKMPDTYKAKCVIELYGSYDIDYVNSINNNILLNDQYAQKVRFRGRYKPEEISNISNTIDIMVLPSLCADTAPQTIFESFSCQLPIIAPRVGGFPDFIKDNVNGLLYLEASVDSLKEKLMYIIDNPHQVSMFRSHIPELKTISQNCCELVELYKSPMNI
jgi:glycosyltransferase involved in cell wall biosynthesis